MTTLATAQLLRLASPALPVGAYAWSGGLESAVELGIVTDAESGFAWIDDALSLVQARWDAAIVWRLLTRPERALWNARYLASRETSELYAETSQIGKSLVDLLIALDHPIDLAPPISQPAAWALAANAWHIPARDALDAWLVAFCENQLVVLQKALPLGQVAAQRLFSRLLPAIASAATIAQDIHDDDLSSATPGLAIVSAAHEHQYSRLFRS